MLSMESGMAIPVDLLKKKQVQTICSSNLPSISVGVVTFYNSGVTVGEAKQAKAALENAFRAHSNSPSLDSSFWPTIPQGT
jgi:hypothetical protein